MQLGPVFPSDNNGGATLGRRGGLYLLEDIRAIYIQEYQE